MICQSCGIMAKRYVVGSLRSCHRLGCWRFPISCQ